MFYEYGYPQRVLVTDNGKEALKWINKWNGIKNLYRSVYGYNRIILNGRKTIDYQSAVVDKIFFDIDPTNGKEAKEIAFNFSDFLQSQKLKHYIRFSGRGWHVFVLSDVLEDYKINKKKLLLNAQEELIKDAGLGKEKAIDRAVFGDISRVARIPNTINLKTNKYAMNWDVKKDTPCKTKKIIGSKFYSFDMKDVKEEYFLNKERKQEWEKMQAKINPKLNRYPPCISYILQKHFATWVERFMLITFFKEKGYSIEDVKAVLKKYLTKERVHGGRMKTDYEHAVEDEKMVEKIFNRYDYIFPSCGWIKKRGLCPVEGMCRQREVYKE